MRKFFNSRTLFSNEDTDTGSSAAERHFLEDSAVKAQPAQLFQSAWLPDNLQPARHAQEQLSHSVPAPAADTDHHRAAPVARAPAGITESGNVETPPPAPVPAPTGESAGQTVAAGDNESQTGTVVIAHAAAQILHSELPPGHTSEAAPQHADASGSVQDAASGGIAETGNVETHHPAFIPVPSEEGPGQVVAVGDNESQNGTVVIVHPTEPILSLELPPDEAPHTAPQDEDVSGSIIGTTEGMPTPVIVPALVDKPIEMALGDNTAPDDLSAGNNAQAIIAKGDGEAQGGAVEPVIPTEPATCLEPHVETAVPVVDIPAEALLPDFETPDNKMFVPFIILPPDSAKAVAECQILFAPDDSPGQFAPAPSAAAIVTEATGNQTPSNAAIAWALGNGGPLDAIQPIYISDAPLIA